MINAVSSHVTAGSLIIIALSLCRELLLLPVSPFLYGVNSSSFPAFVEKMRLVYKADNVCNDLFSVFQVPAQNWRYVIYVFQIKTKTA
jgi:hypothetical protein